MGSKIVTTFRIEFYRGSYVKKKINIKRDTIMSDARRHRNDFTREFVRLTESITDEKLIGGEKSF